MGGVTSFCGKVQAEKLFSGTQNMGQQHEHPLNCSAASTRPLKPTENLVISPVGILNPIVNSHENQFFLSPTFADSENSPWVSVDASNLGQVPSVELLNHWTTKILVNLMVTCWFSEIGVPPNHPLWGCSIRHPAIELDLHSIFQRL